MVLRYNTVQTARQDIGVLMGKADLFAIKEPFPLVVQLLVLHAPPEHIIQLLDFLSVFNVAAHVLQGNTIHVVVLIMEAV